MITQFKKYIIYAVLLINVLIVITTVYAGNYYDCECFNPLQRGNRDCSIYCDWQGGQFPCGLNSARCGFKCINVTSFTRQCFSNGRKSWVHYGNILCESCKFSKCAGGTILGKPLAIDAPPGMRYAGIGEPCDF